MGPLLCDHRVTGVYRKILGHGFQYTLSLSLLLLVGPWPLSGLTAWVTGRIDASYTVPLIFGFPVTFLVKKPKRILHTFPVHHSAYL